MWGWLPFPFTREGRQTLVYIVFAGCGPANTAALMWAMWEVKTFPGADATERLDLFGKLAGVIAASELIISLALACFVSIRAIKIGRDGIEARGGGDGGDDAGGDRRDGRREDPCDETRGQDMPDPSFGLPNFQRS